MSYIEEQMVVIISDGVLHLVKKAAIEIFPFVQFSPSHADWQES